MVSGRVPEWEMVAGAVRAELARRNIVRRDAVMVLMQATAVRDDGAGLGRTAAYERIAGLVPFSPGELEILSRAFTIPIDVLSGTRAPDVAVVRS